MMKRTDFKNISKGEIISFASKLGELKPEVAKEVLAQFPEFVGLMKTALTECKGMLDEIISSDDNSINAYYGIANKKMDSAGDSRKQFYEFVKQVQADCSKLLDNPNLSPEIIMAILNREAELVKIANEKDTEIREQEKEIEDEANKKDTEKESLTGSWLEVLVLLLQQWRACRLVYLVESLILSCPKSRENLSAGMVQKNYAYTR